MREKELCDMKEAYAEKIKKCDAWEKVENIPFYYDGNHRSRLITTYEEEKIRIIH